MLNVSSDFFFHKSNASDDSNASDTVENKDCWTVENKVEKSDENHVTKKRGPKSKMEDDEQRHIFEKHKHDFYILSQRKITPHSKMTSKPFMIKIANQYKMTTLAVWVKAKR